MAVQYVTPRPKVTFMAQWTGSNLSDIQSVVAQINTDTITASASGDVLTLTNSSFNTKTVSVNQWVFAAQVASPIETVTKSTDYNVLDNSAVSPVWVLAIMNDLSEGQTTIWQTLTGPSASAAICPC